MSIADVYVTTYNTRVLAAANGVKLPASTGGRKMESGWGYGLLGAMLFGSLF